MDVHCYRERKHNTVIKHGYDVEPDRHSICESTNDLDGIANCVSIGHLFQHAILVGIADGNAHSICHLCQHSVVH